jgi:hypothetical protein
VLLSHGNESIGDTALIHHFDRAGVQTTRARPLDLLVDAPFDNRGVDPRQRQLRRQHQARRAAARDHHIMFCHRRRLCGMARGLRQPPGPGII